MDVVVSTGRMGAISSGRVGVSVRLGQWNEYVGCGPPQLLHFGSSDLQDWEWWDCPHFGQITCREGHSSDMWPIFVQVAQYLGRGLGNLGGSVE